MSPCSSARDSNENIASRPSRGWPESATAMPSRNKVWADVESDPAKLADLVASISLLREATVRAALYPKVEPLLHKAEPAEVRRAAITASAAFSGHDLETFNTLATMVKAGTERSAAVASLQRVPRKTWPKDLAAPLVDSLIAYLQS